MIRLFAGGKKIAIWRRLCQLLIIALFCALPWINHLGYGNINGSLFAFDFLGMPFADPAAAAQVMASAAWSGSAISEKILIGALIALLVALFMGRIFCGWLCPFGFFSDLIWSTRKKSSPVNQAPASSGFWIKSVLAIILIFVTVLIGYPVLSMVSFPGALSILPVLGWQKNGVLLIVIAALPPLIMLAIEIVSGKRIWCRFCCPQSVFLGIAAKTLPGKFPGLRISWNASQCTCGKAAPCREACQVGLNPRSISGPPRRDCTLCGDCIATCSKKGGALKLCIQTKTLKSHAMQSKNMQ